jgi:hypothetical protein
VKKGGILVDIMRKAIRKRDFTGVWISFNHFEIYINYGIYYNMIDSFKFLIFDKN